MVLTGRHNSSEGGMLEHSPSNESITDNVDEIDNKVVTEDNQQHVTEESNLEIVTEDPIIIADSTSSNDRVVEEQQLQSTTNDERNDALDNISDPEASFVVLDSTSNDENGDLREGKERSESDDDPSMEIVEKEQIQAQSMSLEKEVPKSQTEDADSESPEGKLPATVTLLTSQSGVKVYIVGTAHFSHESQDDVAKVRDNF